MLFENLQGFQCVCMCGCVPGMSRFQSSLSAVDPYTPVTPIMEWLDPRGGIKE